MLSLFPIWKLYISYISINFRENIANVTLKTFPQIQVTPLAFPGASVKIPELRSNLR